MAERVTKVTLTASVAQYITEMDKARQKTQETASAAQKLAAQGEAFQKVGKAALALGTLAAVGVGLAISKFAEFDQAMSNVQAATHESTSGMAALRDAAIEAGRSTVFSATESANAIEELSKAGVSTADILNGALDGALSLAAAGGIGVAEAAETAAKALNQFNLEGSETEHVADLFAAGAGKASGEVTDLGMAMSQVGQVANGVGLSIDETTTALAAFASQGLLGSDAGTSFKSMLGALTPNTAKAAAAMEELNFTAFDGQGKFVGLEEVAGRLRTSFAGLTDEQRMSRMEMIFGSDAVRAATALYNEGASGIADWTEKVVDQGYAAETARIRLDNLKGDIEKLGGAFDSVLIQSGSGANDALRALTQGATGVVDAIGGIPTPILNIGLALTGLAAAVTVVGGAALLAMPKVAEFKAALASLNISGASVARGVGGVSAALVAAGAAFAVWAQRQADLTTMTRDLEASLDKVTQTTTEYTRETVARILAEKGVFDVAKEAGIGQKELTDAVLQGGDALKKYRDEIGAMNNVPNFFTGLGVKAGDAGLALDQLGEALPKAKQNLEDQAKAADKSAESTGSAASEYIGAADGAEQLTTNLQSLIDTVNEANGVGQDAISQNIAYRDAMFEVDEVIRKAKEGLDENNDGVADYTATLDQNTEAGRDNLAMLNDMAGKSQDAAEAQFALDGNTEAYRATLEAGRQALIDRAEQLGYNSDQAKALADQIYRIPDDTEWEVIAETAAAQAALDQFIFSNDGRTITLATQVAGVRPSVRNDGGPGGFADGGVIPHLAGGSPTWWRDGVVQGTGGPRADRVAAMLSPGEFVVNADASSKHRAQLHAINSGRGYASTASVDMGPVVRALGRVEQGLREVRDRAGVTVPMGQVQGAFGSSNVGNTRNGRGS